MQNTRRVLCVACMQLPDEAHAVCVGELIDADANTAPTLPVVGVTLRKVMKGDIEN